MFLADASTRRPVAMSCLLIALVGLGLNAYRKLALESLPRIDIPYVTISTVWVGATPNDMEQDVARRLEDAVAGLDGLKHVTTQCLENLCHLILEFELAVDVDVAAVEVREKIDRILADLPQGCDPPVIEKININAAAIASLALVGSATLEEKYDYADQVLADRLSTLKGVGKIDVIGGNVREVHVELDRMRLSSAGLTSADVVRVLAANVNSLPAGRVRENGSEVSVKFDAEYADVEAIAGLEVVSRNGVRWHLRDLGGVRMTTEEVREKAFFNGEPGVLLNVIKKADGNTVDVVRRLRQRMEELQPGLPGGMRLEWVSDDGKYVQASVRSALGDIIGGILLCGLILLLFLGSLRSAVVVCISMPLTVIISLFFLQLLGYTLNTATLLAIGLSVGILVSNSIVVLESVVMHLSGSADAWEASRTGTGAVGTAVLAAAGTNVVVMLPIGMMSSLVGRFFAPFALTTLVVNLVSIFISFTLTPMLCAVLLRSRAAGSSGAGRWRRFVAAWESLLARLADGYVLCMRPFIRRRWLAALPVLATFALFGHALTLADRIGFTFMEEADRGRIFIKLEFPVDYDLERTGARVNAMAGRLSRLHGVVNVLTTIGRVDAFGVSTQAVYLGQIQVKFLDKGERVWSIFSQVDNIRTLLQDETDCLVTVAVQSEMGGMSTPVEIEIHGDDLAELDRLGLAVRDILRATPGTAALDTTVRDSKVQLLITPKRTVLADAGLTAAELGSIMRGNLEGLPAATYKSGDRSYDIRVKFSEISGRDQIGQFLLPGPAGTPVLLETVADLRERRLPVAISRGDKSRMVRVTSTLRHKAKLSAILAALDAAVSRRQLLPPGYTLRAAGEGELLADATRDFLEAILLAVFLTYLTLAAILESFTRPLLIMLTLPLGLIGILWALYLTGFAMSIFVLLGIVMLIGVVVNAAVLIFDRLGHWQQQGAAPREAMLQALRDTFRPVLMVILASALGMLPLALGSGLGSEVRTGIGIAACGGVIVAGVLTMIILPLCHALCATASPAKPQPQPDIPAESPDGEF